MCEQHSVKLYFDFISQPSRALFILMKASRSAFEEHLVDLLQGEHLTDEYQDNTNRFKKVPAIVDGDFKLSESIAILRYLNAKQLISQTFYSVDVKERARIDEFLECQHNGIRTSCSLFFRFVWVQQYISGESAAPGKVAKYQKDMEKDLQLMENLWLKDNKYLTGDQLTVADVFGACEVEQIRICGYEIKDKYPKVYAWIQRISKNLSPYFNEAHARVYELERQTLSKSQL